MTAAVCGVMLLENSLFTLLSHLPPTPTPVVRRPSKAGPVEALTGDMSSFPFSTHRSRQGTVTAKAGVCCSQQWWSSRLSERKPSRLLL